MEVSEREGGVTICEGRSFQCSLMVPDWYEVAEDEEAVRVRGARAGSIVVRNIIFVLQMSVDSGIDFMVIEVEIVTMSDGW